MIADRDLSVFGGGIKPLHLKNNFLSNMIRSIFKAEKVNPKTPLKKLPKRITKVLFEGSSKIYTYVF